MQGSEEEIDNKQNYKMTSTKGQSDSCKTKIYSLLALSLLSIPFLMGLHINALGNASFIRARSAMQIGVAIESASIDQNSKSFPESLWSLGCFYPLGGLVGALGASPLMALLGRKYSSYIFILSSVIGSVLKFISYWVHFALLIIGRFFDGIGSAGLMVTSIVLMFELVSKKGASFAKPLIQININAGILFIAFVTIQGGLGPNYQYSFLISLGISFYGLIATALLPESPVWLYENNSEAKSIANLQKVHGDSFQSYFDEIKERFAKTTGSQEAIGYKELFGKRYRGAIISTILLNCAQQLSGINCIMAFAPTILNQMNIKRADLFSLIITSSAFLGSLLFAPFVSLRKRKPLLMIGHCLMALSLVIQLFIFHFKEPGEVSIGLFSFFVFIFQIAPGPLVWFICMEIFPPNAVSAAQSIGVAANWISNAIVFAIAGLHQNIMILFAAVNVFITIYLYFFVVETYDRTPKEILDEYEERFSLCKC